MDFAVTETLEHLRDQLSNPAEFFEAVQKDFQENHEDYDGFRAAFESRGFGTAGDEFARYVDERGKLELLTALADEQPAELAAAYEQLGEAGAGAPADAADHEDALWQTAVDQFGPAWAAWDGGEAGWAEYRDWFYDATNSQDPAMYAVAYERLAPLDGAGPAERVAWLRESGFDVSGTEGDGTPSDGDAGGALWQTAVDQFGPAWAAWDGSEAGWAEYRDWFYDATNSQDPAMYAVAYEHLAPLDGADPAERVTRLREFGFDVSGTGGDEAPADEEAVAEQTESERLADYRALADDPAIEGIDNEMLDQLLADPDFESKMADARATVDAEIEAALAEDMPDA